MADPPKRTISAKLILNDIQAGMNESEIKRKFGLSDKGYQSVLGKLSEAGLLKKQDLRSDTSKLRQEADFAKSEVPITWRCPACGTPQTRAYEECPQCGVIVAKASAAGLQGPPQPQLRQHETGDSGSGISNRWAILIVSILAFIVVGAVLLKWSSQKTVSPSASSVASSPGKVNTFTAANFQQEVKDASNAMPVLITFYADW